MIVMNCLLTGIKSRDRNFLDLALFFFGSFLNASSNLYTHFFFPTIEPYIGSWVSLLAFTLFAYNYLNLKDRKAIKTGRTIIAGLCIIFIILSLYYEFIYNHHNKKFIQVMDVSAALIILGLITSLILLRAGGNRKAGTLIIFESLIIIGAISAMGIFKDAVADTGIPAPLLQGNFIFLAGMAFNGLLFSFILGSEMTALKVQNALSEREKAELHKLNHAKNNFMMNISHELRTPVTIINGIIYQLRRGRWGNSIRAAEPQFEIIARNNLRLLKQINSLLELSQLDQHRVKMNPAVIKLNKRLLLFSAEFQAIAEQKDIRISVSCNDNVNLVADPHLFDMVILNLLSNAVKYTQNGGEIKLSSYKRHNNIIIEVSDDGPGIPAEQQELIFQRFQQVENIGASSWRGSGIGLTLVKEILELHNGSVDLVSSPGKGSTFIASFPASKHHERDFADTPTGPIISTYKADLETAVNDSSPEIKTPRSSNKKQDSILVVEDNRDLLSYLESELSQNFNIATALNGKAALEKLKTFKPDLIISDIMMPEMDGRQLYLKIAKTPEYEEIPFLFLTARDSVDEKLHALQEGVVDYISKPFSIEELTAKAAAIINSIRNNSENYREKLKKSVIDFIETFESESRNQSETNFNELCEIQQLTSREKEIAVLIRKGMSDKEIATELDLSVKTISNYNTSIFRKLEVAGRSELIALNRD